MSKYRGERASYLDYSLLGRFTPLWLPLSCRWLLRSLSTTPMRFPCTASPFLASASAKRPRQRRWRIGSSTSRRWGPRPPVWVLEASWGQQAAPCSRSTCSRHMASSKTPRTKTSEPPFCGMRVRGPVRAGVALSPLPGLRPSQSHRLNPRLRRQRRRVFSLHCGIPSYPAQQDLCRRGGGGRGGGRGGQVVTPGQIRELRPCCL